MRIHTSDAITAQILYAATSAAGMTGVDVDASRHGSRTHAQAWEVSLTGTSSRRPNPGTGGNYPSDLHAATWDEWGMFLAALYAVDPQMRAGGAKHPTYTSAEDFHAVTRDRYRVLTAPYQHGGGGHRWESDGEAMWCTSCEAEREHPATTLARREREAVAA